MYIQSDDWVHQKRVTFLSLLAHEITVCARSTYEPGSDMVLQPELLRSYNEVLHRVTGSLRDYIESRPGMPIDNVISMIADFGERHRKQKEMVTVISGVLATLDRHQFGI